MAQNKSEAFKFLKELQQVQEWLEKVMSVHLDRAKFLSFLEDGSSLCSLAIWIDDRCIPSDKMYVVPRNLHQKRDNIFLFVEACKDFGVPASKLFKDTDLLEKKNIQKVVRCLEALEEIAVTKHNFAIRIERLTDDEVAYTPEELAEAETLLHKPVRAAKKPTGSAVNIKQLQLEIQARGFKLEKFIKIVTRIQAIFRGKRTRTILKQRRRAQAFRDNVAKEIFSTEETYVHGLQNLVNNYKVPLAKEAGSKKEYISNEDIKTIFSDVEIILGYNTALLEELKPRIKKWNQHTCLGDIFLKITKFLKVYTSYVKNYDDALTALANCKKDKEKFAKFLRKKEEEGQGNIEMLLILPIQRIPRYNLLLEQLVKHTWEEHPDRAALVEAYNTMKDVAAYVNEKKREFESIAKVREIQNAFVGKTETLISPNRKFIRSDHVYLWTNNFDLEKKSEQLMVTLFNDLIVVSTPNKKGGTLKFKEAIRVGNVKIKEPKLRKWATKRATLNASKDGVVVSSPDKRERSDSVSSEGNIRGSLSGSVDSPGKGGTLGGSLKKDSFASKNTLELINSKEETILKVVFESAVSHASWAADFKKTKEELDQIDAQKTERAKKLSEATKHSITSNFLKSMEEKKANLKTSSIDPDKQQQQQQPNKS